MHAHRIFSGYRVYDMGICRHHFGIINDCQDLPEQFFPHTFCHIVTIKENIGGALVVSLDNKHLYPQVPESLFPAVRERDMGNSRPERIQEE